MYNRILVPLDGSQLAESALPLARALARRTGAVLHVISVLESTPSLEAEPLSEAARRWIDGYLDDLADELASDGVELTTGIRSGRAVETILTEATAAGVDLIVMATHGRGAFARTWVGSVADGVIRGATIPVLLVRPDEERSVDEDPGVLETILIPLDGSPLSESALQYAVDLGELFGSSYHLTRVVSFPLGVDVNSLPYTVQLNQQLIQEAKVQAAHYLEEHAERMRRRGFRVTTAVVADSQAARGILSEAHEVRADLIAMATHGHGGFKRLLLGSSADKVLRGGHVPLLLHRPAEIPAAVG